MSEPVSWGVVLECPAFNIRTVFVVQTEFLEDAIWKAKDNLRNSIINPQTGQKDTQTGDIVARSSLMAMFYRNPPRRDQHISEFGYSEEKPQVKQPIVEALQTPKMAITEEINTEASASRLLMLVRDKYAKDAEKAHLQDLIDRLGKPVVEVVPEPIENPPAI